MNLFEGRNVLRQEELFDAKATEIREAVLHEREECARAAELLAEGYKAEGQLYPLSNSGPREAARTAMTSLILLAAALRNRA